MQQKQKNKTSLQSKLGFDSEPKTPLLLINILSNKQEETLAPLLQGLVTLNLQTVIAPIPTHQDLMAFRDKYPEHLKVSELDLKELMAGADMVYFHGENPDEMQIKEAFLNKTVPIVKKAIYSNIINFDPIKEKGNSFNFDENTDWNVFASIVRATENYKFSYDWENIVKAGSKEI